MKRKKRSQKARPLAPNDPDVGLWAAHSHTRRGDPRAACPRLSPTHWARRAARARARRWPFVRAASRRSQRRRTPTLPPPQARVRFAARDATFALHAFAHIGCKSRLNQPPEWPTKDDECAWTTGAPANPGMKERKTEKPRSRQPAAFYLVWPVWPT